ncbi:MAG: PilZ domain-containing protein [Anaerolineae bacterium]|nr:PilZ domain-containing protein [Anaerolineae bacterium]
MPDYLVMFQKLAGTEENIRFMNVYKGVPISYYGRAVESGANSVRFHVHANQILCMREEKLTYLYSVSVAKVVRASLLGIDLLNETVLLTGFEPINHPVGNRSFVRVEPKDLMEVLIENEELAAQEVALKAFLIDISLHGAAVFLNVSLAVSANLSRGERVKLSFTLPDEQGIGRNIRLAGEVRNIVQVSNLRGGVRIGVQTHPDKYTEQCLSRYIAQRQNEILKEIRQKVEQEKRLSTV